MNLIKFYFDTDKVSATQTVVECLFNLIKVPDERLRGDIIIFDLRLFIFISSGHSSVVVTDLYSILK